MTTFKQFLEAKSTKDKIAHLEKSISDQQERMRKMDSTTLPQISRAISPKLTRLAKLKRQHEAEAAAGELAKTLSKDEFIRRVLGFYKAAAERGTSQHRAKQMIDGARSVGVNYPEFATIEKSMTPAKDRT